MNNKSSLYSLGLAVDLESTEGFNITSLFVKFSVLYASGFSVSGSTVYGFSRLGSVDLLICLKLNR